MAITKTWDDRIKERKLLRLTVQLSNKEIHTGIFGGTSKKKVRSKSGTPIAMYGAVHEYKNNGARSFLRWTFDKYGNAYNFFIMKRMIDIVNGDNTVDGVLTELSLKMMADVKIRITDLSLIDTGALRLANSSKVVTRKGMI